MKNYHAFQHTLYGSPRMKKEKKKKGRKNIKGNNGKKLLTFDERHEFTYPKKT